MSTDGTHWLPGLLLDACIGRPWLELDLDGENSLIAKATGGDLAFMRDASGLVIGGEDENGIIGTSVVREWRPKQDDPLKPTEVLTEAMSLTVTHDSGPIMTDPWAKASLIEVAQQYGVGYTNRPPNGAHWEFSRRGLLGLRFSLPHCETNCRCDGTGACTRLVDQLRRVRVVPDGDRLKYDHARIGGAHGDLAESWACMAYQLRHGGGYQETYGADSVFGDKARFRSRSRYA